MKKLLIYIIGYNVEKYVKEVFERISIDIKKKYSVEILFNDDNSQDDTYKIVSNHLKTYDKFNVKLIRNPINQGYGGIQKIGYYYAIKNKFDYVALLHGDAQYAPEYLEKLTEPIHLLEASAVFGSRMLEKGDALKGGMPLYKYIGNKILSWFQNFVLSTNFSEFHSGYRVYKVSTLQKIPFQLNANNFSFDTDIILQLVLNKFKIVEVPIPTHYGDQLSGVNGIFYAIQVSWSTIRSRFINFSFLPSNKFSSTLKNKAILDEENKKLERLLNSAEENMISNH